MISEVTTLGVKTDDNVEAGKIVVEMGMAVVEVTKDELSLGVNVETEVVVSTIVDGGKVETGAVVGGREVWGVDGAAVDTKTCQYTISPLESRSTYSCYLTF